MRIALMAGVVCFIAGCTLGEPEKPDIPLPTDGPGQVVVKVPGMVCEECPQKVAVALSTIPWIEADSIRADRKTRQVKFTVKDRSHFDLEMVKDTVRKAGYSGTKLLVGPTEQ
jgi:copper chaperone CopZ